MAQEPVPVSGIWLRKKFAHLGNDIEVLAEVDGVWRLLGTWTNDDGCISHIMEPAKIRHAPPDPLVEPRRVRKAGMPS
ncbi:MAG TPA: hypothetical protein VGW74_11835 [Propionibacteriaceae bacterium]|nr:hypothetical protein [Propionibacteriaceae bacterium]